MAQATSELGLALEPLRDLVVLEQLRVQDLHRERAPDLDVARLVDRTHRTFAEPHLDLIAVRKDRADQLLLRLGGGRGLRLGRHQNLPTTATAAPPGDGSTTRWDSLPEVT